MPTSSQKRAVPWPVWMAAFLAVVAAAFVGMRLEITNEITHFLASGRDAKLGRLSRQLTASELTRTHILVVGRGGAPPASDQPPPEQLDPALASAADAVVEFLEGRDEVAWVRSGFEESQGKELFELYFERRHYFLAENAEAAAEALTPEGMAASAAELKRQLGLPTAALVKQTAPRDPLGVWPRILDRLQEARGNELALVEGRFVTRAGEPVVFFGTVGSPFASGEMRPLQAELSATVESLQGSDPALVVLQSGVSRFAVSAEKQIRGDITRISVISTVGLLVLFVLAFRHPFLVLGSLLPLAAGVLGATAISLLIFERIHGLTLAFGASLIGVCIDYPVHLFNHHVLHPGEEDQRGLGSIRTIRMGLILGAGTTIAGFVGLGWTSFPGIREIAVFATCGIACALATTLWVLPPLMPSRVRGRPALHWAEGLAAKLLAGMERRRRAMSALPVLALILCGLGLPQVAFEDDVSKLSSPDADLLAEDEAVRARVSRAEGARIVAASGPDLETALQRNEEAAGALEAAVAAGELEAFRNVEAFLWSGERQAANAQALLEADDLRANFDEAFAAGGFRPQSFGAFFEDLELLKTGEPAPMTLEDLRASAAGRIAGSFVTELKGSGAAGDEDQVVVMSFLQGLKDAEALEARLESLEGVEYFDQKAMMQRVYGGHRASTLKLVALGLIAVFGMLWLRYRELGISLAAFVPAGLAASTTAAIFGLAGIPLHLLHVVALLLVLSMGVDYGVFLAESARHEEDQGGGPSHLAATSLSLLIACLSTVLAFGLLGMSSNPALQAIGWTTGLGVCLSLLLAPTSLVLLHRRGAKRG